jgi:hypothetical protein
MKIQDDDAFIFRRVPVKYVSFGRFSIIYDEEWGMDIKDLPLLPLLYLSLV